MGSVEGASSSGLPHARAHLSESESWISVPTPWELQAQPCVAVLYKRLSRGDNQDKELSCRENSKRQGPEMGVKPNGLGGHEGRWVEEQLSTGRLTEGGHPLER